MNDTPQIGLQAAQLVLTELRRQHNALMDSVTEMNTKATSLLEWASLSMAVVSALSIKDLVTRCPSPRYLWFVELPEYITPLIVLWITFALYIAVVILCLRTIWPYQYELPVGTDWNELCDLYLVPGEQDATEQLLTQYRAVLSRNQIRAAHKGTHVKYGFLLFPILIASLVFLVTHQLWEAFLP